MARKPVPQYVRISSPSPTTNAIMIDTVNVPRAEYQTPSVTAMPEYRSANSSAQQLHSSDSSDAFYAPRKMSAGRVVATGTQDLAEFLKSSKPEDFGSTTPGGSSEDLSKPKKRRFLRSSSAEKAKGKAVLPIQSPHVISKTTTKGKPYLQIHVNYGNTESNPDDGSALVLYNPTQIDPQTTVPQTPPPPWRPPEDESSFSQLNAYEEFVHTYRDIPSRSGRKAPVLAGLSTDFTADPPKMPEPVYKPLHSPVEDKADPDQSSVMSMDVNIFYSPTIHGQSSYNAAQSHHCNFSQDGSIGTEEDRQILHSRSILPQPGPPPDRGLPSLPDVAHAPGSPSSGDDDRKRREERVKARKARDMKQMQQRKLQEALRLLDEDAEAIEKATKTVCLRSVNFNPANSPRQLRRGSEDPGPLSLPKNKIRAQPPLAHDTPTPPRSPDSVVYYSGCETRNISPLTVGMPRRASDAMPPPPTPRRTSTAKERELEKRLDAMERKHIMLEHALITVLQRTLPNKSQSNSIENLLAEFRLRHPCTGLSDAFPLEQELQCSTLSG